MHSSCAASPLTSSSCIKILFQPASPIIVIKLDSSLLCLDSFTPEMTIWWFSKIVIAEMKNLSLLRMANQLRDGYKMMIILIRLQIQNSSRIHSRWWLPYFHSSTISQVMRMVSYMYLTFFQLTWKFSCKIISNSLHSQFVHELAIIRFLIRKTGKTLLN